MIRRHWRGERRGGEAIKGGVVQGGQEARSLKRMEKTKTRGGGDGEEEESSGWLNWYHRFLSQAIVEWLCGRYRVLAQTGERSGCVQHTEAGG